LEPETLTTVLGRPEFVDSTIVGVNRNGADLEVPLGFEVTVTVETPGTPAPTTVNEPVTTPPVIEHVDDAMMLGAAVMVQVASLGLKPVPETDTMVPAGPKLGTRSKADGNFVKEGSGVADTAPSELGKITEYDPGAAAPATVKLPVIWKVIPEMLQDTPDSSPGGVLNNTAAQTTPASAALKPEPVTETDAKDSPLVGVSVITGVTANVALPKPPPTPDTSTAQVPPCAVALTVKEAERAPVGLIVHVGAGTPAKRFDPAGAVKLLQGPASAAVKAPVTLTGPVPVRPEYGKIVKVTGTPFTNEAEAMSMAGPMWPWTVTV
jgi:hypothetical protein